MTLYFNDDDTPLCCSEAIDHVFFDEDEKAWCLEIENDIIPIEFCPFCGEKL